MSVLRRHGTCMGDFDTDHFPQFYPGCGEDVMALESIHRISPFLHGKRKGFSFIVVVQNMSSPDLGFTLHYLPII